jgi:hypothetical protein
MEKNKAEDRPRIIIIGMDDSLSSMANILTATHDMDIVMAEDLPNERDVYAVVDAMKKMRDGFSRSGKSIPIIEIEEAKRKAYDADNRDNAEVREQRNQNRLRAKFHRR